jgi:TetR/AcrR family transcriptional regulator, transcriptional repressor of bet genes
VPKQVDHEARRGEIAVALWRAAQARGLDRVSLREVATEAGISLGQLQHYFANRDEMMLFAVEFMSKKNVERVAARVLTLDANSPAARVRAIVQEMLPVDDDAKAGSLMNLSFLLEAARNEKLGAHARRRALALRNVLEGQLALAMRADELSAGHDPTSEAARLIGLAEGLRANLHLGVLSTEETLTLMEQYLDRVLAGH